MKFLNKELAIKFVKMRQDELAEPYKITHISSNTDGFVISVDTDTILNGKKTTLRDSYTMDDFSINHMDDSDLALYFQKFLYLNLEDGQKYIDALRAREYARFDKRMAEIDNIEKTNNLDPM